VKAGADFIKVMATGGGLTPNTNPAEPQFDREEMVELARDAARLGRHVAAHCHGTPGIHHAIAAGVRTIEHCSFMTPTGITYEPAAAEQIAERGIYVCPTLGAGARMMEQASREGIRHPFAASMDARNENLRRMWAAGVQFVSGNDAGVPLSRFDDFQLDLELLVEHVGVSGAEAILTATGKAAEAIGSDDFGTLQPGKRADVLVVRGDPLGDIGALRNVLLVVKSGQVVVDK
jgi:imidazolonepropionase-like amidohydrolase